MSLFGTVCAVKVYIVVELTLSAVPEAPEGHCFPEVKGSVVLTSVPLG